MKLLVCTANQPRHVALVRALRAAGHDVLTIVEPKSFVVPASWPLGKYWEQVREAEYDRFGLAYAMPGPVLALRPGELSQIPGTVADLLVDRFPVVFSSSYLRGWVADDFIARGALNLHVGIAPEYRGSAPNIWAWYDKNEHLIGAQVQRLAAKLDAGDILADTRVVDMPRDPFARGMLAVQQGIDALVHLLAQPPATWQPCVANDPARQIRYSRHADFTEAIAEELLARVR